MFRSAGWARPMRSPRRLCFLPPMTPASSQEQNCLWTEVSRKCRPSAPTTRPSRVLADQLRGLISFDHLDVLILKENSSEIEWHGWGTEPAAFPDLPVEETSSWHVFNTQEPCNIANWDAVDKF